MEEGCFVQPVTYILLIAPPKYQSKVTITVLLHRITIGRMYKVTNGLQIQQRSTGNSPNPLSLELASNALSNKRHISPAAIAVARRRLGQLIGRVKPARAPTSPPQVHIRVVVQHIQLLAHSFQAARIVRSTTSLSQDGLTLVRAQPVAQRREGLGVVGRARRVRARVVRVEVLVHVEDQVRRAAVEVGHFDQRAAGAVGDEGACRSEVCAWKQNFVAGCAGFADGGDGFLDGCGPGVDVEIVLESWC